jgi:hypothetical protein
VFVVGGTPLANRERIVDSSLSVSSLHWNDVSGGQPMSIIRSAVTAAALARTVIAHPVVRAGIAAAPLLLTPKVKAAAKDATLNTAYKAGQLARKIVDSAKR